MMIAAWGLLHPLSIKYAETTSSREIAEVSAAMKRSRKKSPD